MHNNKLYSILTYFDKYERNRLRKYLLSPYFNKNETLVTLFEVLTEQIDANGKGNLDKEVIWEKLLPQKPYDDVRFRKLCSDLLKLIEGFLAQQIYDENSLHKAAYLIEAVGKKKMEKLYSSTMRTARRLSEQQFYKASSYYFNQYQIEKSYYSLLTEFELDRTSKTNIESIINNLDYFFLSEKLRLFTSILMRKNIVSHEYQLLFMDEIITHVKKYKYDDIPPIAIYYQLLLTQTDSEKEEHYYKLRELLQSYGKDFPPEEIKEIYTGAINYCISKINKGIQKFLNEFLELNVELLEEGVFAEGELSPWKFQNIVIAALRLGKYQWTENFILKYKEKLSNDYRENAVNYCLAQVFFYQKKYDKVLLYLQQLESADYFAYVLNSKVMLIATYYELDEIEPLASLIESFRTYLNRHKDIPADRRKNYLNLLKFVKRLIRIIPSDKKSIDKLKTEVANTKGIPSKIWLQEKIAELG